MRKVSAVIFSLLLSGGVFAQDWDVKISTVPIEVQIAQLQREIDEAVREMVDRNRKQGIEVEDKTGWKKTPIFICDHHFEKSKFWITAELTSEEPQYYPPSGLTRVEVCSKCGILRIPPKK